MSEYKALKQKLIELQNTQNAHEITFKLLNKGLFPGVDAQVLLSALQYHQELFARTKTQVDAISAQFNKTIEGNFGDKPAKSKRTAA